LLSLRTNAFPSYDLLEVLVPPVTLTMAPNDDPFYDPSRFLQETNFAFFLTNSQITRITKQRNIRNGSMCYDVKVMLRVCIANKLTQQCDNFPDLYEILINNRTCPLPKTQNRQGELPDRLTKPIDVTTLLKINPGTPNRVVVHWRQDCSTNNVCAIGVYLVQKMTASKMHTHYLVTL
jgi:hypothetical protein